MGWAGKKFAGIDELCNHYNALGIDAKVLPEGSPEALEKGLLRQDMGYIKVAGKNFDLVTIRMKGGTSGSYSLGTAGPVNIGSKQKIRFEYHHIVRTPATNEAMKASLKKQTKGMLSKQLTGVSWEGGRLADTLNSDTGLNAAITGFLDPSDDMKVEPDQKNNAVRVVFSRVSEIKSGLIYGGFQFDRNLLPKEAIDAADRIAGLIR